MINSAKHLNRTFSFLKLHSFNLVRTQRLNGDQVDMAITKEN